MRKKTFVLFLLLLTVLANGVLVAEEKKNYPPARDFTLKTTDGDEVRFFGLLENGPVYMVFWDLVCVNCIAELDALLPVYDSLKDRGLQIVALSVDKPSEEARVRAFVKSKKWPYIVLLDQQQKVRKAYNVIIKPTAYLVNMAGEIVFTHIGYKKGDERRIKDEILKWLPEREEKEEAPPEPEDNQQR